MQQQNIFKFNKGYGPIILFVLIQFQMSADCNLHGFSPQDGVLMVDSPGGRPPRKAQTHFGPFPPPKKHGEKLPQFSRNGDLLTGEIRIKQGRLKGIVREFRNKNLKNVETFLGIPYAAPPVKSLRFMPPGSPPTWKDVKIFDSFAPVCPQTPPDLTHEPFQTMNAGYFNRLKGLMPFLSNQSEDCLYLNIYTPMQGGMLNWHKRPEFFATCTLTDKQLVIIYYDNEAYLSGPDKKYSAQASFTAANPTYPETRPNSFYPPIRSPDYKFHQKYPVIVYIHGESFEWNSGNPYDGSVLASYGNVVVVTINFRLGILGFLRPGLSEHTVSNFGLLDQIAALQWIKENIEEFGGDPTLVTLMGHGTGAACINFLMVSPVSMASQGLFHKAILMSGTALADWALTHNPLQFTIQVAEALNCPLVDKNDELSNCLRRKRLSEIMSVRVTVPEFQTAFGPIVDGSVVPNTPQQVMGVYQSLFTRYELLYGITEWESYHVLDPVSLTYGMLEGERNEFLRKYMYSRYEALPYFALATTLSEYLDWRKAIPPAKSAAEEHRDLVLDLLSDARFAAPIIQMALYHSKINPKSYLYVFQHKSKMGEFAGSDRSISGEEIAYVFGIPVVNEEGPLSQHKFSQSEQLLSEAILTYFTNFAKTGNPNAPRRLEYITQGPKDWQQLNVYWPEYDFINQSYLSLGIPPYVSHHYRSRMTQYWNEILPDLLNNPKKLKHKPDISYGEVKNSTYQKPSTSSYLNGKKPNEDSAPWTYGVIRTSPEEYHRGKRPFKTEEEREQPKQMDRPLEDPGVNAADQDTKTSMVPYFVAVSVCLLAINVAVIGFYCYRKRRNNAKERNSAAKSEGGRSESDKRKVSGGDSIYSVVECSESSRSNENEKPKRLQRYLNSTTEGHARVKKWIQQEIVGKYSKNRKNSAVSLETVRPVKKSNSISEGSSRATPMPKPILKNSQRVYQSSEDLKTQQRKSVQKVSIGIDATPSTRGESVLKQTPIEITKSLDRGLLKIGPQDSEDSLKSSRRSRTSISLQLLPTNSDVKYITSGEPEIIKLGQQPKPQPKKGFQTFMPKNSEDINVTSRDSITGSTSDCVVDPLENIQRRNFPKVLPDFPESKLHSLPRSSLSESGRSKQNPPPPPPPRVSTLQRNTKQDQKDHSTLLSFFGDNASEGKKAEGKFRDDDSATSNDSSKGTVVEKPSGKKREKPSIVIQPKGRPKREEGCQKRAHVNLQAVDKKAKDPPRVLDSKGPSDKVVEKRVAKSFRL